jgi:hypothetical protein
MTTHIVLVVVGLGILAGLYGAYPGTGVRSAIIIIALLVAGALLLAAVDRTAH